MKKKLSLSPFLTLPENQVTKFLNSSYSILSAGWGRWQPVMFYIGYHNINYGKSPVFVGVVEGFLHSENTILKPQRKSTSYVLAHNLERASFC
jgi:hypothetical protein